MKNWKKEILLEEGHRYFKNCHASTIVKLPNGDLLVAYFAGMKEGSGDTAIWVSRKTAGKWQTPVRTISKEGTAHWNPVLHQEENKLWLFYKVGATVHTWKTRVAVSEDDGQTWIKDKELVDGDPLPRGPVKNKLLSLSNGHWLAPGSTEDEIFWDAFVDDSANKGLTWEKYDVPFEHKAINNLNDAVIWEGLQNEALWENDLNKVFKWDGIIQPTLWESKAGYVHMLLRSTRGTVYRSDSSDYGKSWCPAYPTMLPNNNSGLDVVKLANGYLVLIYNPISGNWSERSPISISFSKDNGNLWTDPYHFEIEKGEFSYPAIISCQDEIHVTYTWNRKNIVYQFINIPASIF